MEQSTKKSVRLEHCIAVSLVGDKNFMLELAIKETQKPVLHVKGNAYSFTELPAKNADSRPTIYIKGAFEGINLINNHKYISGQLILPDSASSYIISMLQSNPSVYVDITILVERSLKSIIGYKFLAEMNEEMIRAATEQSSKQSDKKPDSKVDAKADGKADTVSETKASEKRSVTIQ